MIIFHCLPQCLFSLSPNGFLLFLDQVLVCVVKPYRVCFQLVSNLFDYSFAVSLKADTFEGFRFDFAKGLNQKFSLCHR